MKSIEERFKTIIVQQLGVELSDINPESLLMENLGCDSLDRVELAMAVEEEFGIALLNDDETKEKLDKIRTFAEALALLTQILKHDK